MNVKALVFLLAIIATSVKINSLSCSQSRLIRGGGGDDMFLINKFIRKLINIQGNRKLKFSRKCLEIVDVLVLDMRSKLILFSKVAHIGKTCSR